MVPVLLISPVLCYLLPLSFVIWWRNYRNHPLLSMSWLLNTPAGNFPVSLHHYRSVSGLHHRHLLLLALQIRVLLDILLLMVPVRLISPVLYYLLPLLFVTWWMNYRNHPLLSMSWLRNTPAGNFPVSLHH